MWITVNNPVNNYGKAIDGVIYQHRLRITSKYGAYLESVIGQTVQKADARWRYHLQSAEKKYS